jgi:hypothetical protein
VRVRGWQALLLDVVRKHRPFLKVWRPFRAWRRTARKSAMQQVVNDILISDLLKSHAVELG